MKNDKTQSVDQENGGLSRRDFLKLGGAAGAAAPIITSSVSAKRDQKGYYPALDPDPSEATIAQMQEWMENGEMTAEQLTRHYLTRISLVDKYRSMDSVIATNPDAMDIARALDEERASSGSRGPLHGIPILLKDNIDTGDSMQTTAGSLALAGSPASQDATVTDRLRAAGAIILGKTNLSEWANFRGFTSSSGWSAVGGLCSNPYYFDRNACGSSSGSGAAVSANLCAAALGTETDGSVVCPASTNGVVGIKPTVGLTSRAGVVPISATQDTVGIHGRTVADAAAVLGPLTGVDSRDPATSASDGNSMTDYSQYADPEGLAGTRIGVARQLGTGTDQTAVVFEQALQVMRDAGAEVVDVEIPSFDAFSNDSSEIIVLIYEFKRDLNAYLATRSGVPVTNLNEVIEFNLDNFEAELKWFGQEFLELSQAEIFSQEQYEQALITGPMLAGEQGLDATLADFNVDAIVAPTNTPAWPSDLVTGDCFQFGSSSYAAVAGYPLVTVPMGNVHGLPVGMTFMAGAWSEPTLIKVAAGFEAAAQARIIPGLYQSLTPKVRVPILKQGRNNAGYTKKEILTNKLADYLKPRIRRPFYL